LHAEFHSQRAIRFGGQIARRPFVRLIVLCLVVASAYGDDAFRSTGLKIVLVEGQGAINLVNQKMERRFTIRVEEKYGAPGKGIPVTFTLPASGAGGQFTQGRRVLNVTTDANGYAVARGYRPNGTAGQYSIEVSAATPQGTVTAFIPQTNAIAAEDGGRSHRKLIFTMLAAAAAGTGAILGLAGN
jgi:hypothetical protein